MFGVNIAQSKKITIEYSKARKCYLLVSDKKIDYVQFSYYSKKKKRYILSEKIQLNNQVYEIPKVALNYSDKLSVIIKRTLVMINLNNLKQ